MYGEIYYPGIKHYPLHVQQDVDVGQMGNSRRELASQDSANQQPACGVGVSTPCGAVLTRTVSVFVAGLLVL